MISRHSAEANVLLEDKTEGNYYCGNFVSKKICYLEITTD